MDFSSILSNVESSLVSAIRSGQIDPGSLQQIGAAAQSVANQAQIGAAASSGARQGAAAGSTLGAVQAYAKQHPALLYVGMALVLYFGLFRRRS